MSVEQFVLTALQQISMDRVTVKSVTIGQNSSTYLVVIDNSEIKFIVNDQQQFQITAVIYNGVEYFDPEYLAKFNEFVISIIPILHPVTKAKMQEYEATISKESLDPITPPMSETSATVPIPTIQPQAVIPIHEQELRPVEVPDFPTQTQVQSAPVPGSIEDRERQAQIKEEQLKKRALALQARARLLEFQMQAVDVEDHFFHEVNNAPTEPQDIKSWIKKGQVVFELVIMIVISLLIVVFLVLNTR